MSIVNFYFFIVNLIYYIFILNPIFIDFFAFLGVETRGFLCPIIFMVNLIYLSHYIFVCKNSRSWKSL